MYIKQWSKIAELIPTIELLSVFTNKMLPVRKIDNLASDT